MHADCGEGDLLGALAAAAWWRTAWSPAARSALRALERGLCRHHRRGVRAPGRPAGGITRRHRAERGGRPPPAARAGPAPRRSAGARWRAMRRSSSSSEPVVAAGSWEAPAARPGRGTPAARGDVGAAARTGPASSRWCRWPPDAGSDGRFAAGGRHALVSGIHHFVPVLHRGDAVGRHTLRLRDATRARGFRSEIYVDTIEAETAGETRAGPVLPRGGPRRATSSSTSSPPPRPWRPWLAGRSETLVVNYHNITPPELMAPWDNHLALGQLRAQGDLRLLAPRDRPGRGRLRLQRGTPRRGGVRRHGGHPALGGPRAPS